MLARRGRAIWCANHKKRERKIRRGRWQFHFAIIYFFFVTINEQTTWRGKKLQKKQEKQNCHYVHEFIKLFTRLRQLIVLFLRVSVKADNPVRVFQVAISLIQKRALNVLFIASDVDRVLVCNHRQWNIVKTRRDKVVGEDKTSRFIYCTGTPSRNSFGRRHYCTVKLFRHEHRTSRGLFRKPEFAREHHVWLPSDCDCRVTMLPRFWFLFFFARSLLLLPRLVAIFNVALLYSFCFPLQIPFFSLFILVTTFMTRSWFEKALRKSGNRV